MIERDPVVEDPTGKRDDFQQIKGIGPSIAQALHASGVHRFADLARYTPEELVNLLSPKVAFITTQRIERDAWLAQARELTSEQVGSSTATGEIDETPPPAARPLPTTNNHIKHPSASWQEIADFFVSFGHDPGPRAG